MIPRLIFQGQEVEVTASFLNDLGEPIISGDNSLYPQFQILDPNQDFITGGVGTYDEQHKVYKASFTMPVHAVLSDGDRQYRISWEMVDSLENKYVLQETFDVANPDYDITDAKELQKLTLPQIPTFVSIPVNRNVESVQLGIFAENSEESLFTATAKKSSIYNDYFIYSYTIPVGILSGGSEYILLWRYEDTHEIILAQVIHCATLWEMQRISDLRMYLDKVAKRVDTYQGYRDSDLCFHLKRGIEIINGIGLLTSYTLKDFQTVMNPIANLTYWLLEAAKYSALRAQFLAEADSTFNFSSQPVTLEVDRTGFIESELGRIWDGLTGSFVNVKNQIVKNSQSMGYLNITLPSIGGYYPGLSKRTSAILGRNWFMNFKWY